MIEKEPGNHKIHRLRVIHLYEADLGATFAILWKKMFAQAEHHHAINSSQYGGRKGHEAAYLPYAEELKYDISRLSRRALVNFDNDAQSCYDRIVPSIASLLGRFHGLHPNITRLHADVLQNTQFQVKTSLGVSEERYCHSPEFPVYGTGQGSTNSPIIWSMISSKLFDVHHQQATGASFCTPDQSICVQESAFGFVDDTTCQTNDFLQPQPLSRDALLQVATSDAKVWSYLLYITGGLLELPKCSVHIVFPKFYPSGHPFLCSHREIPPIHLPDPRDGQPIEIPCHPHHLEHKTLGHYKAPSGCFPKQRAALLKAANALATMIFRSFLFPEEARMVYFAIFLAKFAYVLPQCYFPPSVLRKIESKAQQAFTAKLGFNRKMACAIRYGPPSLGGVGLVRLETLQGVGQILNFVKHWRSYTYVGSLLRCTLAWAQINAGISMPILQIPSLRLDHFESKFLQSLRRYLASIDASIEVDTPFIPPCQREFDVYLMEFAIDSMQFEPRDLKRINYCRLYLQAVTASDIVLPDNTGDTVDPSLLEGHLTPMSPRSTYCMPLQARPWQIWHTFCALLEDHLRQTPLGRWIVPGNSLCMDWQCYHDYGPNLLYRRHADDPHRFYQLSPTLDLDCERFVAPDDAIEWSQTPSSVPILFCDLPPDRAYPTERLVEVVGGIAPPPLQNPAPLPSAYRSFSDYVATLSPSVRSLLAELDIRIPADELVEILNDTHQQPHFKCVGVSDGSALADSMTFGWTLAAPDGFRMVACAGPAYGYQASSYRAEGYGFVSMATFLFHFCHFCEAIPDWTLTLASDNLGLVTKVSQSWHYDFPFPNLTLAPDYDIIHETVMLLRQARVAASFSHVKGHQDSTSTPFDSLPLVAQLNIKADDLAGTFRRLHENESHPTVPLLSHTRCILHLNDTDSVTRSYTTVLRNHVATPALRTYMIRRFHWPVDVFHSIDWALFHRCRQKLLPAHRQVIKFSFDILPTSAIVARSNPALSATCPLCSLVPETNAHIYQCSHGAVRSWRSSVMADLRVLLDKWDTRYGLVEILMAGLGVVFGRDSVAVLDPVSFPASLHPVIRSQNSIGWHHLLSGRASTLWAPLQHEVYTSRPVPPPPAISGAAWMTDVLTFLMSQVLEVWKQRNALVHSSQSSVSVPYRREKVLQELRLIHSLRESYRAGDVQFLLTADPDHDEAQFCHLLDHSGIGQVEGWIAWWTPFFKASIQQAKLRPTAAQLTPSIRTVFRPIRRHVLNLRRRPPEPPPSRGSRRRTITRGLRSVASFFCPSPSSAAP